MAIQIPSGQTAGPKSIQNLQNTAKRRALLTNWRNPITLNPKAWLKLSVKNLKSLVIRCDEANEDLRQAIATWWNMVRTDGSSPAQTQKHC